jgi:hypothetical protein
LACGSDDLQIGYSAFSVSAVELSTACLNGYSDLSAHELSDDSLEALDERSDETQQQLKPLDDAARCARLKQSLDGFSV